MAGTLNYSPYLMTTQQTLVNHLLTLNKITNLLTTNDNIEQMLQAVLERLVRLMHLKTGWIFLADAAAQNRWAGKGFVLAAHTNLPPAMAPHKASPWQGTCDCQHACLQNRLTEACNEVQCSRLAAAPGDREQLAVHASAPLRAGEKTLGILNVAAPHWETFNAESLALLANIGSQMGIALERARLFDLLQERRIDEQQALLTLSNQLLSRPNLDDLLPYLASTIRRMLQADACAVLLPDEAAQALVFVAAAGWQTDPVAGRRTLPADDRSGPGQVMRSQQPLLVPNMPRHDPAPWLTDWLLSEKFRGHAVMPLIGEETTIGVLTIDLRRPHTFDDDEVRFMRLIANQAAIAIEKARLKEQEIARHRLEEELAVARRIQRTLLPATDPSLPGWEFASRYAPARLVGGDFYDYFELPGKPPRLGMVIADVADKGIPAALFMALSRSIIRTKAMSGAKPATVFGRANRLICKDSRSDLFVTAVYAILNPAQSRLTYTNAGHNRPLCYHAAGQSIEELKTLGTVLGVFEQIQFGEATITLKPHDVLVFYTDGITEAMNAEDNLFGTERLRAVVSRCAAAPAQDIVQAIVDAVQDFCGPTEQSDDFTLFIVKKL